MRRRFFFALALCLLGKKTNYQPIATLLLAASVGLLILTRQSHQWLSLNVPVALGLISYPLYLWHYPIIAFSTILEIYQPLLPIIQLVLSILLGWGTYHFIEIEARKITNPFKIISLTLVVIGLGGIGGYLENSGGLPERTQIQSALEKLHSLKREPSRDRHCVYLAGLAGISNPGFEYCRSSTAQLDAKFTAVIGDSHAHAIYAGISKTLRQTGYQTLLLAQSGSPGFLGGAMGKNEVSLKRSEETISQVYRVLDRLPHLEKVMIVARGPIYFEEKGFGLAERDYDRKVLKFRSYFEDNKTYEPDRDYFMSLENTIRYFEASGKAVFLWLENPELGFSPQTCIDRPYNVVAQNACRIPFITFKDRMKKYRNNIKAIAQRHPRLHLVDPARSLCDREWCYAMKDGKLLYSDDDHLSVSGSELIAQELSAPLFD